MERFDADKIHAWVETGEVRAPQARDVFLSIGSPASPVQIAYNHLPPLEKRKILAPIPGPLYRLEPGESVLSPCERDEATHALSKKSARIYPLSEVMHDPHECYTPLRITPVAVPQDEREIAIEVGVNAATAVFKDCNMDGDAWAVVIRKAVVAAIEAALAAKGGQP